MNKDENWNKKRTTGQESNMERRMNELMLAVLFLQLLLLLVDLLAGSESEKLQEQNKDQRETREQPSVKPQ